MSPTDNQLGGDRSTALLLEAPQVAPRVLSLTNETVTGAKSPGEGRVILQPCMVEGRVGLMEGIENKRVTPGKCNRTAGTRFNLGGRRKREPNQISHPRCEWHSGEKNSRGAGGKPKRARTTLC